MAAKIILRFEGNCFLQVYDVSMYIKALYEGMGTEVFG